MTENNQAAASEDDQDVGHVGVGAYVALIITILFSRGFSTTLTGTNGSVRLTLRRSLAGSARSTA